VSEFAPGTEPGAQQPPSSPGRASLKSLRVAATVIWAAVILALCWTPKTVIHEVGSGSFWEIPHLDKIVHGSIFIILAILWLRIAPSRRMIWIVLAGGFALALVSELGQLMPFVSRDCNFFDFLIDFAGVLIGLAVAPFVEPLLQKVERGLLRIPARPPLPAESAGVRE
jgi:hypothetical protein